MKTILTTGNLLLAILVIVAIVYGIVAIIRGIAWREALKNEKDPQKKAQVGRRCLKAVVICVSFLILSLIFYRLMLHLVIERL